MVVNWFCLCLSQPGIRFLMLPKCRYLMTKDIFRPKTHAEHVIKLTYGRNILNQILAYHFIQNKIGFVQCQTGDLTFCLNQLDVCIQIGQLFSVLTSSVSPTSASCFTTLTGNKNISTSHDLNHFSRASLSLSTLLFSFFPSLLLDVVPSALSSISISPSRSCLENP